MSRGKTLDPQNDDAAPYECEWLIEPNLTLRIEDTASSPVCEMMNEKNNLKLLQSQMDLTGNESNLVKKNRLVLKY